MAQRITHTSRGSAATTRFRALAIVTLGLAALGLAQPANAAWSYAPWTGDADSGISTAYPYTAAVNLTGHAVTVNGVAFEAHPLDYPWSGANYTIEGATSAFYGGSPNITGDSFTLATDFQYDTAGSVGSFHLCAPANRNVTPPDLTPPAPNPMGSAVPPAGLTVTSVVMAATAAADAASSPVSYCFDNTNTGANSGWIPGAVWINTGLTPGFTYGYRVKARDAVSNVTAWSAVTGMSPVGGEGSGVDV